MQTKICYEKCEGYLWMDCNAKVGSLAVGLLNINGDFCWGGVVMTALTAAPLPT